MIDALTRVGTEGRFDWPGLCAHLRESGLRELPEEWHLPYLLNAAFLNSTVVGGAEAIQQAAALVRLSLEHIYFPEALKRLRSRLYVLQIAHLSRDRELLREVFARVPNTVDRRNGSVSWAVRTDELLPVEWTEDDEERVEEWWRAFNEPFAEAGLEDWEFRRSELSIGRSVFSCIHAPRLRTCEVPVDRQPLVTVIVPTYCPGQSFLNTIESLVHQSWQNLDILIVDDASPSGQEFIDRAVASDPRIRMVRMEVNGGAYKARNRGMRLARGEYVTVVDSDDQSHPRKIERQIIPLLRDPSLLGTMAYAMRVFDNGSIVNLGGHPVGHHLPSLLYRKEQTISALGYYDDVRKAADTEYAARLRHRFGGRAILNLEQPLDLYQLTAGSLSRNDFRAGWFSDRRVAYRHQWKTWHENVLVDPEVDHSPIRPDGSRAFVAPPAYLKEPMVEFVEFAYLSEWATSVEQHESPAETVRALAAARPEHPVGLLHGVHPRWTPPEREFSVSHETWELVETGAAAWISWDEPVHVGTLVVPSPEYLLYLPVEGENALVVDRVVIGVDTVLQDEDGRAGILDPRVIEERCRSAFGVEPSWIPATSRIGAALAPAATAELLPAGSLRVAAPDAGRDAVGAGDPPIFGFAPFAPFGGGLGRLRRFFRAVPRGSRALVYDGYGAFPFWARAARPHRVSFIAQDELSPREFVERVDVLVLDPFEYRFPLPQAYLWAALARGVVVVAPEGYRNELGDAVTAFPPGGLEDLLARLGGDREFFGSRREAARSAWAEHASPAAFAGVLARAGLIGEGSPQAQKAPKREPVE
nr:glycosyltransferase family 2 protein [Leucobacter weissii]